MTWPEVVLPDELFSTSDPQSKLHVGPLQMLAVTVTLLSQGNVSEEARDVCKKLLELLRLQDVEFLTCSSLWYIQHGREVTGHSHHFWEQGTWKNNFSPHPLEGGGGSSLKAAKERSISQT